MISIEVNPLSEVMSYGINKALERLCKAIEQNNSSD